MVPEVCEAGGGDVERGAEGNENENEVVDGRCSGLIPDRDNEAILFLGRESCGCGGAERCIGGYMVTGRSRCRAQTRSITAWIQIALSTRTRMIRVYRKRAIRQERDRDGEFRREEEGEVEEAGPAHGGVARGPGLEAVLEDVVVGLGADFRGDEDPAGVECRGCTGDARCRNALGIGDTAGEKVGTWFAHEEFEALGEHEGGCEGEEEAHVAS